MQLDQIVWWDFNEEPVKIKQVDSTNIESVACELASGEIRFLPKASLFPLYSYGLKAAQRLYDYLRTRI